MDRASVSLISICRAEDRVYSNQTRASRLYQSHMRENARLLSMLITACQDEQQVKHQQEMSLRNHPASLYSPQTHPPDQNGPHTYSARSAQYAPASSFAVSLKSSICIPLSTVQPSAVRSGLPSGAVVLVKNRGFHSTPLVSLSFAFCRCLSSISCLTCVAREYCLLLMAAVTSYQKRRDSFGSWRSSGGTSLGIG